MVSRNVGILLAAVGFFLTQAPLWSQSAFDLDSSNPFAPEPHASNLTINRSHERLAAFQVRIEVWEVGTAGFALQLDSLKDESDFSNWRQGAFQDSAAVLLQAPVLSLEEKSTASVSSDLEWIYPTEYDSDGRTSEDQTASQPPWQWVASPKNFEVRSLGTKCEVSVQPVTADKSVWDLGISLEETGLAGFSQFGPEKLKMQMPAFTELRASGSLRVREGEWRLLSSQASPQEMSHKPSDKCRVILIRLDRDS